MANLTEAVADPGADGSETRDYTVEDQKVELDLSLASRAYKGRTEILVRPHSQDLRQIYFHARQSRILSVSVDGKTARYSHYDPYRRIKPHSSFKIRQYHLHRAKLEPALRNPPPLELAITIPPSVKIQQAQSGPDVFPGLNTGKSGKDGGEGLAAPETPAAEYMQTLEMLTVAIEFVVDSVRDGLQYVGIDGEDARYPHLYTRNTPFTGMAACLFPCIDDLQSRNTWEVTIKTPRTLGDAFKTTKPEHQRLTHKSNATSESKGEAGDAAFADDDSENILNLTDQEKSLDITVVCSGELTDEITDPTNSSLKSTTFAIRSRVSANQIGFAVGPFESVDLSDFRDVDEDDKLGSNATQVRGFCLPGRSEEVRNTAMPIAKAVDFFTTSFTTYPFENFHMCFLDDMREDTAVTAAMLMCSSRLLFPADILDPLMPVTRRLVHGLACQYSGICMTAKEPSDNWAISGIASFMADVFIKQLSGNNEYRWAQKMAAERVCEMDVNRPSLYSLGPILELDPSEAEFLSLKSGVVLFILDRRLAKTGGSAGMTRIISRLLTNAKTGDTDATLVSTSQFQRQCEKLGHVKLDAFFNQWVYGAGCPILEVRQSFNKKKLVVNITIEQKQSKQNLEGRELNPNDFIRDLKEETGEVWAGQLQPVFTGPMTIRIHEADGTPYEHIVEIKDIVTNLEIPYNTKYKRLKRSKRQKERGTTGLAANVAAEAQDDVLLYCLGDVLQSKEEFEEWRLVDWPEQIEHDMGEESYEWVRMDADFEWICRMTINLPSYMFVSQLQQDRDVVAQYESLKFMAVQNGNALMATFLIRTLMDRRYFHGIRTMAASLLPKTAKAELDWVGLFHLEKAFSELFCVPGSAVTRPNDFSDRVSYTLQCEIPKAIATIKDNSGHAPIRVKRFFTDKLKFNDNSDNEFSDCFYISTLLKCLVESLTPTGNQGYYRNLTIDEEEEEYRFKLDAINELERHRRIDEWISSYQNTFSLTALEGLSKLARVGVMRPKLSDFLQYTREGNAEALRIKAFQCLVEQGMLRNPPILKYIVHVMSYAESPHIRQAISQAFGKGLGELAMGDKEGKKEEEEDGTVTDGLVIEQEASTDERAQQIARRTTITGAAKALRDEVGSNEDLQEAIWAAFSSPAISLQGISTLFDLCDVLFDTEDKLLVTLRYPRYWQVRHLGKGQLKFSQTSKVRFKPRVPLKVVNKGADAKNAAKPQGPKISLSSATIQRRQSTINLSTPTTTSMAAPKSTSSGQVTQANDLPRKTPLQQSLIVKLRVPGDRLRTLSGRANGAATYGPWAGDNSIKASPTYGPIKTEPQAQYASWSSPATNGAAPKANLDAPAAKLSKKRKSDTPQPPGADHNPKKRRSQTPKGQPAGAPQYAPYVGPSAAKQQSPPAPPAPPANGEDLSKKPAMKIRLSFGPGSGKAGSPQ